MATIVEYNGVTLYNVLTRKWDEEVFYDQSGTDEIGKKYSFVFQGVLHQQRVPLASSDVYVSSGDTALDSGFGDNVFTLLARVKNLLNHPRKTLKIFFGTVTANVLALQIDNTPVPAGISETNDIDNGPKPRVISVVPIGSTAFRVTFAIEATVGTCSGDRTKKNMVISNRWSISEAMDENYYVLRRISGQMRLGAGVTKAGVSDSGEGITEGFPGHYYKGLIVPPLEGGFKRESMMFTCAADGLTCTYEVADKQVHTAAPWPATKLEATHREGTQYGTFFTSEMSVRLTGDAACDKLLLIERAIQILDRRLVLSFVADGNQAWINNFEIIDHIGEQAIVEASASINRTFQIAGTDSNVGEGIGPFWGRLGRQLNLPSISVDSEVVDNTNYKYQLSRVPSLYGYKASEPGPDHERRPIVLFFLHCYLQNPCSNVHQVGPGEPTPLEGPSNDDGSPLDSPTIEETSPGTILYEPSNETFSDETKTAIYTTSEVSSEYCNNTMMIGLPIANLNAAQQSSPGTKQGQKDLLLASFYGEPALPSTRILPLARPQAYRIHRLNLERIGVMPAIPAAVFAYQHGEGQAVLKDFKTEVLTPIRSPDGTQQVYRVVATYLYQLDRVPDYTKAVPVGKNPTTKFEGYEGQIAFDFTGDFGVDPKNTSSGPQTG